MVKIINLEKKLSERLANRFLRTLTGMNTNAKEIAGRYYNLMLENPEFAIENLPEFIESVRDINPNRSYVEAVAGGPNHDWTAPMLDIIGVMYPSLDRNLRKKALSKCFNFLDFLNYFESQNHVALINEPHLVADIVINNQWYWCGHEMCSDLLQKYTDWPNFLEHMDLMRSEFWLAYTITKPKYSSLEIRYNFYKQFPDLMDRTKYAIAAISYVTAQKRAIEQNKDFNPEAIDLSAYDPLLHQDIRNKMQEKKWIDLNSND